MPKFFSVRTAGELEVGDGMYSGEPSIRSCPEYKTGASHPAPWDDTALMWRDTAVTVGVPEYQCLFGFGSIGQLRAWLYNNTWLEWLHAFGYVVKVWDLPESAMHVGSAQAIATKTALEANPFVCLSLLEL